MYARRHPTTMKLTTMKLILHFYGLSFFEGRFSLMVVVLGS